MTTKKSHFITHTIDISQVKQPNKTGEFYIGALRNAPIFL